MIVRVVGDCRRKSRRNYSIAILRLDHAVIESQSSKFLLFFVFVFSFLLFVLLTVSSPTGFDMFGGELSEETAAEAIWNIGHNFVSFSFSFFLSVRFIRCYQ